MRLHFIKVEVGDVLDELILQLLGFLLVVLVKIHRDLGFETFLKQLKNKKRRKHEIRTSRDPRKYIAKKFEQKESENTKRSRRRCSGAPGGPQARPRPGPRPGAT